MEEIDDALSEGWFAQGELVEVAEAAPEASRRSRVGMVIAAVSAAAFMLVIVFAGHF